MEESSTEVMDNIEYLMDKFNVTVDLTGQQLKDFSVQMAHKIITWEIATSALLVFTMILLLIIYWLFNIRKGRISRDIRQFKDYTSNADTKVTSQQFTYSAVNVIGSLFFFIILAMCMYKNIYNIIMCFAFPEKVILEFISQYI